MYSLGCGYQPEVVQRVLAVLEPAVVHNQRWAVVLFKVRRCEEGTRSRSRWRHRLRPQRKPGGPTGGCAAVRPSPVLAPLSARTRCGRACAVASRPNRRSSTPPALWLRWCWQVINRELPKLRGTCLPILSINEPIPHS
jgi:hypothetical protein